MSSNLKNVILKEFKERKGVYESCESRLKSLIGLILDANCIQIHSITSRTKSYERLSDKIERKNKYECIEDITDLVGIRVITYFEDEIDTIAELISSEFEIDPKNSIDKRIIENDRFGYKSLHYVAKFKKERLDLMEYSTFSNISFEIQIRSILQHSWAEIEHDIGYKGEFEIPDIAKRTFSRIAALLETADIEFVRLKQLLIKYEESTKDKISKSLKDIKIDGATFKNYITSSELIKTQNKVIEKIYEFDEGVRYTIDSNYGKLIQRLGKLNITSIDTLQKLLQNYESESRDLFREKYKGHSIMSLNIAAPIIQLANYLESIEYGG
jgi:ppGpp synthetase/RelA/SpoT-type nucleotidyltranferase